MGAYINPTEISKESWLEENATSMLPQNIMQDESYLTRVSLPVCLVDNGGFSAAAIAFDPSEMEVFLQEDGRRKSWYLAKIRDLHTVSAELEIYLK